MSRILMAVRVRLRVALREPVGTVTTIAVLAIGICLTTTVFSVVDGIFLRPLPYEAPDQLVAVTAGPTQFRSALWDPPTLDILEGVPSFSQVSFLRPRIFNLRVGEAPERIKGAEAPAALFSLLGVEPILGSVYSRDGAGENTAVIGYRFWQSRFGGTPSVLGRVVRLDGRPHSIVAVMPPTFDFYQFSEVWIPPSQVTDELVSVFARLAPDVTMQRVRAELQAVSLRLQQRGLLKDRTPILARSLNEERGTAGVGPLAVFLLVCTIGVFFVVCANLVNIFLARLVHRHREIALRITLGGGRVQMALQLMLENLPVVVLSSFLAGAGTYWGLNTLLSFAPGLPAWMAFDLNWRVLLYSTALVAFVLLLAGFVPALRTSSEKLQDRLKEGGLQASGGMRSSRWQRVFAGVQMALAMVLLVGAALILRSVQEMSELVKGLPGNSVVSAQVSFTGTDSHYRKEFYRTLMQRIESHPAAEMTGTEWEIGLERPSAGFLRAGTGRAIRLGAVQLKAVDEKYFSVVRARLANGRGFQSEDVRGKPLVMVVSRSLGRILWPDEPVLGQRLTWPNTGEDFTIIGVVEDQRTLRTRRFSVLTSPEPAAYVSGPQVGSEIARLVVRSETAGSQLSEFIRQEVRDLNPDLPVTLRTANEGLLVRIYLWLGEVLGGLGIASTLIALLGVYGLISLQARQREKEMGIRAALGADQRQIRALVFRQAMRVAVPGIVVGAIMAAVASISLSHALFGVSPLAPWLYVAVATFLLLLNLGAASYPALRVSRVNPVDSLRSA